jgi:hypothetical protein
MPDGTVPPYDADGHADDGWERRVGARIYADRQTVFRLLAEIELWPAILPHVRSARVVRRDGRRRLVTVRASWKGLPIGWTAVETIDPVQCRMTLRHVTPLTRGSLAVWTVSPETIDRGAVAVDVDVEQRVVVPLPLVGGLLGRGFVGGRVARELGQKILDRVKEVAEGESLAGRA